MHGFLNLNKPGGWTSHDCVAKIRRLLNLKKVGHGGTLDPAATGVLPIALGRATRLLQYLPNEKVYIGTLRLGVTTTTDDLQGEVLRQTPANHLTLGDIQTVLPQFIGTIDQVPPRYSAIQVDGKRLYNLARSNQEFDVPVRQVDIQTLQILAWQPGKFPELKLSIACGAGTYIRSIARDLGEALGVGGTLVALNRTKSAGFELHNSVDLENLMVQVQAGHFIPIASEQGLQYLPKTNLPQDLAKRWCQGQKLASNSAKLETIVTNLSNHVTCVYDHHNQFLGIGEWREGYDGRVLVPKVVLFQEVG